MSNRNEKNNNSEIEYGTRSKSQRNCGTKSKGRKGSNNRSKGTNHLANQPWDSENSAPVSNNAAMYYTNPILADQVSNFTFNNFLGVVEDSQAFGNISPGVAMTIFCNPCPGITSGDMTAGINIAAMKAYTYLSANNAKTTVYAPQDISTLILAVGEVLSAITVAKRALKVAYTYNVRNRAFPLQLVRTMGFNPQFIEDGQIAKVRLALNSAINRFNQIPIMIDNVTYFSKCVEMYSGIYADSDGPMVQYYVFTPFSTWILDEESYDQGSVLKTKMFKNASGTDVEYDRDIYKFIDTINEMINALLSSATFNAIYSDILRVSSNSSVNLAKVDLLQEDEVLLPEYNPMKLLQIHNSYAFGTPVGTDYQTGVHTPYNDVYPDVNKNALVYLPQVVPNLHGPENDVILDFPHSMGNPDVDQRVDVTRYISMVYTDASNNLNTNLCTMPDHYIVHYLLWYPSSGSTLSSVYLGRNVLPQSTTVANLAKIVSVLSTFDYAPLFYTNLDVGGGKFESARIGDLDYYTAIDVKYLKGVNELALQGLFELRV